MTIMTATLIFCLACLELFFSVTNIAASSAFTQPVNTENPIIHFKPNHQFRFAKNWNSEINVAHTTNNYGFNTSVNFDPTDTSSGKVALIGDSYVEALQVPKSKAIGELVNDQTKKQILPIAISGSSLAQYLAFAEFAKAEFNTEKYIFVIVSNDFFESILQETNFPGRWYFDEENGMRPTLVDYNPSRLHRILQRSRLMQYLMNNLQVSQLLRPAAVNGAQNSPEDMLQDKVQRAKNAVQHFFSGLERLDIKTENVLFLVDGDRLAIQAKNQRDETLYENQMLSYFVEQASQRTFQTIDLHPVFTHDFEQHSQPFHFRTDYHWNERGHSIAADSVLMSGFLD